MNKITKEFILSDIFKCETTKHTILQDTVQGKTPFVSRSTLNNGVDSYVNSDDELLIRGGCITIGAEGRKAFYQPNDFIAGVKVYTLRNDNLNYYNAMYICTILNKNIYKYSYGRARVLSSIKLEKINLPYDEQTDNPDWKYMEEYIKSLNITLPKTENKLTDYKLNVSTWKYFKLSDLFDIDTGADLIYQEQESGTYPVVGHNETNNGITCYIKKIPNRKLYDHNKTISVGDRGCFVAYVQPHDFYIGTRVKALISKFPLMNIWILLFISTIINKEKFKYTYGRNATDKIPDIKIKLPSNNDGSPDWNYMENYIKLLPFGDCI